MLQGFGDGHVGMDCSIIPLRQKDLFMISTTDFFYPLVTDPYVQGMIGCCNVLSDLYAMGVPNCDTMLMLLASSTQMQENERHIVTRRMIEGFNAKAAEAGTVVSGGQTVQNPWPIIGGTATAVCAESEFIRPEHAVPGDVLVLTKPLGTQVVVNAFQWLPKPDRWQKVEHIVSKADVLGAFNVAVSAMSRLNRNGARLMRKYGAHGATDVTGFGFVGHARNLAQNQRAAVHFELHTMPIIRHMLQIADVTTFKLRSGYSAETSGGLLVALPVDKAEDFRRELEALDNAPAWIVGRVVANPSGDRSTNDAYLVEKPTIVDV